MRLIALLAAIAFICGAEAQCIGPDDPIPAGMGAMEIDVRWPSVSPSPEGGK